MLIVNEYIIFLSGVEAAPTAKAGGDYDRHGSCDESNTRKSLIIDVKI